MMVVALFGLSLVMILGGIAAVVSGFPYVRLESGLAMVIGGSTAASSGVILLGLSAVVMRLRDLSRTLLDTARSGGGAGERPFDLKLPLALADAAVPSETTPSVAASSLDIVADRPAPPSEPAPRGSAVPAFLSEKRERAAEASSDNTAKSETEPRTGRIEPEFVLEVESTRVDVTASDDDLFKPRRREPDIADLTPPPAPTAAAPEPSKPTEPAPTAKEEAEAAPSGERVVVGTYASGGNTYVMFADGSIEADTPRGRFTFGSLDELKAFVEAGGENNEARGAA